MRGHIAVERLERSQMKRSIPDFRPGDTIRVGVRVKEGDRERTQAFEGVCIRRAGGGANETFTVRKISYGVGVERTFYLHSPNVSDIKIRRAGKARRARLYYLRERVGKRARVRKERHLGVTVPVSGAPRLSADEATAAAEAAAAQEGTALPAEPETEATEAAPAAGEPAGETADKA